VINISWFNESFLKIQVNDTIIIFKKHYLFHCFWTHLCLILYINFSCKIECLFNVYKEYWTWENIFNHLSQSWKIQDVVSSIFLCWSFLTIASVQRYQSFLLKSAMIDSLFSSWLKIASEKSLDCIKFKLALSLR